MKPRPLQPGDTFALVAPASPFDPEGFERARILLEGARYRIDTGKHIFQRKGYLAGTEAERAEDLIRAICNPEISAVLCVRGGYGSGKLLPWLPFSNLRENRKIFMGFSDITFLHLAFRAKMDWVTFHGPNLMTLGDHPELLPGTLRSLSGETEFSWNLEGAHILREGSATGPLLGGNLTCLTHLVGTPFFPDMTGAILLIEDRGEALYRLDRFLTHLKLAGVLQRLGGLLLGHFNDCGDADAIRRMVEEQVQPFRFPVVANLPFGHDSDNQVFPLGLPFALSTRELTLKAAESPFSG